MSTNRLFILDQDTNEAVCIGKGYSNGWVTGIDYIDDWLSNHEEMTGLITSTRFKLVTDDDISTTTHITWDNGRR